ncbi:MAG: hypothetical protein ACOYK9_03545 [Chlamydiia bacterium]
MSGGGGGVAWNQVSFNKLLSNYTAAQLKVRDLLTSLSKRMSTLSPGEFLLLQMQSGNLSQIGDSISNVLSSMNGICKNAITNMRG